MIIDPVINGDGLEPPHSGQHLSIVPTVDMDGDDAPYKSPDDPPPYTEINGFDPLTGASSHGPSFPRTLSNMNNRQFCHCADSRISGGVPSSGEQVHEGIQQMANSVMFVAEATLIAVGGFAQGFGKVLAGFGMVVAERRAPSRKNH